MTRIGAINTILPIVGALFPLATAQAQVAPPPGSQPTREEITPPVPQDRRDAPSVRIDSGAAIQRTDCPLENSDVRVTINEVRFTAPGGGALPPELVALVQNVGGTGADQPIKLVCDVRDRANAALRRARYVAAVQVPAQRIEDGVLRLEVVSARIVEVRVRGDPGPYEGVLQQRIELLKQIDPLNEAAAEKVLLLAGDIPGLDVRLALRPTGGVPGDVIGELEIDYRRFSLIANAQNYNSRQLGRETAYVRGEIYGLTGLADVTYVGVSSTLDAKEQLIGQAGHVFGIDSSGTAVALRGTYALSRPDLDTLKLKTNSLIASLEVARPLVRSLLTNVGVVGGIEYTRQRTVVQSPGSSDAPLNLDEITALFLRIPASRRGLSIDGSERYRFDLSLEGRKGIDVFSPTKTGTPTPEGFAPSRFEGSATATILRGQLDGRVNLGRTFSLLGRVRGQWANRPLLNFDEFSIGNLTIGRGYDPGANSGDTAVAGSIEPAVKLLRTANIGIETFGFYDYVRLWNKDRGSTEDDRRFRSYGAGVRATLIGSMILEVTYARPQDKALSFDKKPPSDRVLLSLTTQLIPWGGRR